MYFFYVKSCVSPARCTVDRVSVCQISALHPVSNTEHIARRCPGLLICAAVCYVISQLPKQLDYPCLPCVSPAHALPMFREARQRSTRKQLEKDRLDPKKSHKPEPPVSGPGDVLFYFIIYLLVQNINFTQ